MSTTNQTSTNSGNMLEDTKNNTYLGENYPYYKYIKDPSAIGMSSKGTLSALSNNIDGLIAYVSVLVTGKSKASATGGPLGNKFFIKTGAKCTDVKTGQEVPRYVYINNVPAGNIPLISAGAGVNFSEFKGLIPGTISNLNALNPMSMFQSFLEGAKPDCQEIQMEVIDTHNNKSVESNYVTLVDIQNMDPCSFKDKKNPITNAKCRETFENLEAYNYETLSEPDIFTTGDLLHQTYLVSLGLLSIYALYRLMHKTGAIPKA